MVCPSPSPPAPDCILLPTSLIYYTVLEPTFPVSPPQGAERQTLPSHAPCTLVYRFSALRSRRLSCPLGRCAAPNMSPAPYPPCPLRGQDLSPPRPGLNPSAPSVPFVCLLKFKDATTMRSFSANPHPPLFSAACSLCSLRFLHFPSLPSLPFAPRRLSIVRDTHAFGSYLPLLYCSG